MKPWPNWYTPPGRPRELTRVAVARRLIVRASELSGSLPTELVGNGRLPSLIGARAAVAIVLRERGWSYPRIGRVLGGRDHTTIMHACKTFDDRAVKHTDWPWLLARLREFSEAA